MRIPHLPSWVWQALAAIGGFGFIFQQILKPMAAHYMRALLERYDQPVWEIIKQPKYKPHYLTAGKQVYMNVEIPHQLEDPGDADDHDADTLSSNRRKRPCFNR